MTLKELVDAVTQWIGSTFDAFYNTKISTILLYAYLIGLGVFLFKVCVPALERLEVRSRSWLWDRNEGAWPWYGGLLMFFITVISGMLTLAVVFVVGVIGLPYLVRLVFI